MSAWLRFLRIRLVPTVISNVLAGVVLSGGQLDSQAWIILLTWSISLYLFGMALNDLVDRNRDLTRTDETGTPVRPIPAGLISVRSGLVVLCLLFIPNLWIFDLGESLAATTTVAAVLLYNLVLKEIPILGPLVMGLARTGLICTAADTAGGLENALPHAISIGILTTAITLFSQEEERARPQALLIRFWLCLLMAVVTPQLIWQIANGDWEPNLQLFLYSAGIGLYVYWAGHPGPGRCPDLCTFRLLTTLPLLDIYHTSAYLSLSLFENLFLLTIWLLWVKIVTPSEKTQEIETEKGSDQ